MAPMTIHAKLNQRLMRERDQLREALESTKRALTLSTEKRVDAILEIADLKKENQDLKRENEELKREREPKPPAPAQVEPKR
jgi:hypothetical protein